MATGKTTQGDRVRRGSNSRLWHTSDGKSFGSKQEAELHQATLNAAQPTEAGTSPATPATPEMPGQDPFDGVLPGDGGGMGMDPYAFIGGMAEAAKSALLSQAETRTATLELDRAKAWMECVVGLKTGLPSEFTLTDAMHLADKIVTQAAERWPGAFADDVTDDPTINPEARKVADGGQA